MSADHTWLGNRMPCPSRDRGTFWMPRRVPEETAAYTAWAGCLQAPSALRHPVAGGMCLSLLLQHLLYLPCPIKTGQSMCVASISAKSLSSSPNQICPSSMDPSAGPLAMSRYAMALLMPKSSPAVALRLGAICVVVAKLLEEVALSAKAVRSSRGHRHTFACSLLAHSVLALPNMSSAPASSSSFQLTASDRLYTVPRCYWGEHLLLLCDLKRHLHLELWAVGLPCRL